MSFNFMKKVGAFTVATAVSQASGQTARAGLLDWIKDLYVYWGNFFSSSNSSSIIKSDSDSQKSDDLKNVERRANAESTLTIETKNESDPLVEENRKKALDIFKNLEHETKGKFFIVPAAHREDTRCCFYIKPFNSNDQTIGYLNISMSKDKIYIEGDDFLKEIFGKTEEEFSLSSTECIGNLEKIFEKAISLLNFYNSFYNQFCSACKTSKLMSQVNENGDLILYYPFKESDLLYFKDGSGKEYKIHYIKISKNGGDISLFYERDKNNCEFYYIMKNFNKEQDVSFLLKKQVEGQDFVQVPIEEEV